MDCVQFCPNDYTSSLVYFRANVQRSRSHLEVRGKCLSSEKLLHEWRDFNVILAQMFTFVLGGQCHVQIQIREVKVTQKGVLDLTMKWCVWTISHHNKNLSQMSEEYKHNPGPCYVKVTVYYEMSRFCSSIDLYAWRYFGII